jgi:hypothetical protein
MESRSGGRAIRILETFGPEVRNTSLVSLFSAKCPVSTGAQAWIETSVHWLSGQFGDDAMRGEVLLPRSMFPPASFSGRETDVDRILALVCARMDAPLKSIDIDVIGDEDDPEIWAAIPLEGRYSGEAGHYRRKGRRFILAVRRGQLRDPVALTATLAHEVAHVRLLGERRIAVDRKDQEQLTDLATVFFGLGVFTANAAFDYSQDNRGWRTKQLGYLGEQLFGYALAYVAFRRGETAPEWAKHLDTNPRSYMRKGLRFLGARG